MLGQWPQQRSGKMRGFAPRLSSPASHFLLLLLHVVCVCVCVCVYARMYVADGWAGIAYTVIANTCVVTEADN